MAKPFFEHATPQEHFNAINEADYVVQLAMIERDLLAVESAYRVNMALADYKVMTENGTFDDLQALYEEASAEKSAGSKGIFQRLLDLIQDIFGAFKKLIFGEQGKDFEKFINSDEAKNTKAKEGVDMGAVDKSMNIVQRAFKRVKDFVSGSSSADEASNGLVEDNNELGKTVGKIFAGVGGTVTLASLGALLWKHANGIFTFGDSITDCVNEAKEKGGSEFVGLLRGFLRGMKKFVVDGLVKIADIIQSSMKTTSTFLNTISNTDTFKGLPDALSAALGQLKDERADKRSSDLGDTLADLEERLKNATTEAERKKIQKRIDRVKKRKDDIDYGRARRTKNFNFKDKEDAEKQIDELKKEIEKLKDEIEELHKQDPVDEKKVDEKEDELDQKERELNDAEAQADELDKKGSDSKDGKTSSDNGSDKSSGGESGATSNSGSSRSTNDSSDDLSTDIYFNEKDKNGKDRKVQFTLLNTAHELINKGRRAKAENNRNCKKLIEKMNGCSKELESAATAGKNNTGEYKAVFGSNKKNYGNTHIAEMANSAQEELKSLATTLGKIQTTGGIDMSASKDIAPGKELISNPATETNVLVGMLRNADNPPKFKAVQDLSKEINKQLKDATNAKPKDQGLINTLTANKEAVDSWITSHKEWTDKLNTAISNKGKSKDGSDVKTIIAEARKQGVDITEDGAGVENVAGMVGLDSRYLSIISDDGFKKIGFDKAQKDADIIDSLINGTCDKSSKDWWNGLSSQVKTIVQNNRKGLEVLLSNPSDSENVIDQIVKVRPDNGNLTNSDVSTLKSQRTKLQAKQTEYENKLKQQENSPNYEKWKTLYDEKISEIKSMVDLHDKAIDAINNGTQQPTRAKASAKSTNGRDTSSEINTAEKALNNALATLSTMTFDLPPIPYKDRVENGSQVKQGSVRAEKKSVTFASLGLKVSTGQSPVDFSFDSSGNLSSLGSMKASVCGSMSDAQISKAIADKSLLPKDALSALKKVWEAIHGMKNTNHKVKTVNTDPNTHAISVTVESSSAFGTGFSSGLVLMESCEMIDLSEYDSEPDDILDAMNNL